MVMYAIRTFARGVPWNLFLLTTGCFLFALGLKAIAIPHAFISGGVFGTAMLLNYTTGTLSPAVWNILLNIPIFIIGWLFLGRRFVLYSLYGLTVASLAVQFLTMTIAFNDPILAAIASGCICGLGLGIALHSIGCDGGLTIISIALHQRYGISIGKFSLFYNLTLFILAFSMYNEDNVLYSLIMIYVYTRMMDYVSTIFNQRKMVLIISSNHEPIGRAIISLLHRGVTLLNGSGGFTGVSRPVILTVVHNYQIKMLEEIIFQFDKKAFVIIENTLNVLGKGFSRQKQY
ncbi:MAG: YitT family protein [Bilophila sp.]